MIMVALHWTNLHAQRRQLRVLTQQIAALQVYIDYAQKGYTIVSGGLTTIGDLKKGELNLHSNFFASLKSVNPKIKEYLRVAEIVDLQLKIAKNYKSLLKQINKEDLFHGNEKDYIKRVFERLIDNCDANLDELLIITTDGQLTMTDDQRISRIDTLYHQMVENYTFCENFINQIKGIRLGKTNEMNEIKWSCGINNLNP